MQPRDNDPVPAADSAARDNPGSDDNDGGTNDDPVWGYFLGKSAYIFFHELAGAIRAQKNFTAIADTAAKRDQLTALLLIAEGKKRFGGMLLSDAVVGWVISWRQAQQDDTSPTTSGAYRPDTWDADNISTRQMSALLCSLYGSAPDHFHNLVDSGDIKADIAAGCVAAERKLAQQWATILSHFGVTLKPAKGDVTDSQKNDPNTANTNAMGQKGLSLEQQSSSTSSLADFTAWLTDVGLFDNLTAEINRDLTGQAPIKVVLSQCGTGADAASNSSGTKRGELHLCYEWLKPGYDAATAQNVDAPPE